MYVIICLLIRVEVLINLFMELLSQNLIQISLEHVLRIAIGENVYCVIVYILLMSAVVRKTSFLLLA
jgi:hypothetical protein